MRHQSSAKRIICSPLGLRPYNITRRRDMLVFIYRISKFGFCMRLCIRVIYQYGGGHERPSRILPNQLLRVAAADGVATTERDPRPPLRTAALIAPRRSRHSRAPRDANLATTFSFPSALVSDSVKWCSGPKVGPKVLYSLAFTSSVTCTALSMMCSLIKGVTAFMAWTMSPPRWTLAVRYCAQSDALRNTRSSLCPLMMTTDGFQTLFSVRKEHRARHSICTTPCMLCAGASACVWERQASAPRGGGTAAVAESACGSPPRCIRISRCMASGSCAQTAGGRRRRGPRAQVEAVEAPALLLRRRRRAWAGGGAATGSPKRSRAPVG